jgi:hypothetical protein
MYGDFSRLTFRPDKHNTAVLAQQGRLYLDAEVNEQAAIQAYLARTLAADLLGRYAGPAGAAGFEITYSGDADPPDLFIGGGRYYADGILCDATPPVQWSPVPTDNPSVPDVPADQVDPSWTYWTQPDGYLDPDHQPDLLPVTFPFLIYLKVWERLVTAVEDPDIHEKALGPVLPGTTARLRVVWQVLAVDSDGGFTIPAEPTPGSVREAFADWAAQRESTDSLAAMRTQRPSRTDEDPCIVEPDARYRGPENQLYRVEVHRGGNAKDATFKWSRDNGSAVFAITGIEGDWVSIASTGWDDKLTLQVQDWVEVVDDAYLQRSEPAPLLQVTDLDVGNRRVRLSDQPGSGVGRLSQRHPYLRRWDRQAAGTRGAPKTVDGAQQLVEGAWLPLENGVQVWFNAGGTYRPGEYWTAAARTLDGDVEWPRQDDNALLLPPQGPRYHYAPLAWVDADGTATDLRMVFAPIAVPVEELPDD